MKKKSEKIALKHHQYCLYMKIIITKIVKSSFSFCYTFIFHWLNLRSLYISNQRPVFEKGSVFLLSATYLFSHFRKRFFLERLNSLGSIGSNRYFKTFPKIYAKKS